jgi:hypothetical protein
MAVKSILKGILVIIAAAMVLMSIPMFQQSLIGGLAFLTLPVGWLVLTLLRTIGKSIWGVFFLFLGLGLLELSVKTGFPLSWFAFGYLFVFYMVFKGIKWLLIRENRVGLAKSFNPVDAKTAQSSSRCFPDYGDEVDTFLYFD